MEFPTDFWDRTNHSQTALNIRADAKFQFDMTGGHGKKRGKKIDVTEKEV